MKKGMLVKIGDDLFRVLDLQHVTPGNLRGFVRVKFRNIRTGTLSDQKLRSEDFIDRAILDEREMQYLYKDGDAFHFGQLHHSGLAHSRRVLWRRTGGHRTAADGGPEGRRYRARDQGSDRQRAGQARAPRDRPRRAGAAVREHR
jgi:hypothetical protein